ncbi:hypothetical protein JXR93_00150 [bacterium]|nr:hypothetical protein [bacterium]
MKKLTYFFLLISIFIISCEEKKNEKEEPEVISCISIEECPNGMVCFNNICRKNSLTTCESSDDCPSGYSCDVDGECKKSCNLDSDCGDGFKCDLNGICQVLTCETNSDCEEGKDCKNGACVERSCEQDSECISGFYCKNNICTSLGDLDCRVSITGCEERGYVCNQATGRCEMRFDCSSHNDCAEGYHCDLQNGVCVENSAGCTTSDDCEDGEICENQVCIPYNGCSTDSDCIEEGKPACNTTSGLCYECLTNEHCADGYRCNTSLNSCQLEFLECQGVSCSGNGDCVVLNDRPKCNCYEGYREEGLQCIEIIQCDVDQFSTPLNNSSDKAAEITAGIYENLSTESSNCYYSEDWYSISVSGVDVGKTLFVALDYSSEYDFSLKLYSPNDLTFPLKEAIGFNPPKMVEYQNIPAGVYLIKVSDSQGIYKMTIRFD